MTSLAPPPLRTIALDDRFAQEDGPVLLSGVHALVRLLLEQRRRDRLAGLNTRGFVSGYRGSPLGSLDTYLWKEAKRLELEGIVFQPGLNEDLAATAVWGTQQIAMGGAQATVDGVFGLWYGKGPGVDRSLDVLKHANLAGTAPHGGVLAVAGDDHYSQSSTLAHQSDQTFIAAMIPVLNPSTVQDCLDFGLLGFAMSRYAGVWAGLKAVAETVESTAIIEVGATRLPAVLPSDFDPMAEGLHIRWPDPPLAAEARLHGPRMRAIAAFARANALDRLVTDPARARLGIVTTGKAYLDVRQALVELGLDARMEEVGIRLYKVGLSWPLEEEGARRFAAGLEEILVVEEKQPLVETQLSRILYNLDAGKRPRLVGKADANGRPLLASEGQLGATDVARAIHARLQALGHEDQCISDGVLRLERASLAGVTSPAGLARIPVFCSGCPHNTSTRVPEGSRAAAGIGCHAMATYDPTRRTGAYTHMGGEGAHWIGQAAFSRDNHIFQNLGDGTYAHSGLMAIRAAVAAGVNITYKILYNDAVAMTGGQPAEGRFTVAQIVEQVAAEGVAQIVVVSDNPDWHRERGYRNATVEHRDELDAVQRRLRDVTGTTVLVYEQTCAAEKCRRRKRGLAPDPAKRIFINPDVCENCGNCSEASGCVSIVPIETELGRKRAVDQSSCNKDYSCAKGFCPSFLIVEGGTFIGAKAAARATGPVDPPSVPPPPVMPLSRPFGILVAGIGGTGVVTVGALVAMAAHLEGRGCTVSDFTGLSQKGGSVTSHVRLASTPEELHAVRIAPGGADLLLAYDQVVATAPDVLSRLSPDATRAVVNRQVAPTAAFLRDPDLDLQQARMARRLRDGLGSDRIDFVDATRLATAVAGDAIAANLLLLGFAFQKGFVPLRADAIDRAIELNGAAVAMNRRAFAWGRAIAHDPGLAPALLGTASDEPLPEELGALVSRRAAMLAQYQDVAYADRFRRTVAIARKAEDALGEGATAFAIAVARTLHKLMAYKDEYEVARLHVASGRREEIAQQFEGAVRISFSMAPPVTSRRDASGRPVKRQFGPWMLPLLKGLARLRRLRGTRFDPFGRTAERRAERADILAYEALVAALADGLDPARLPLAVRIAALPLGIKGFGHVKDRNRERVLEQQAVLVEEFHRPRPVAAAA